MMKNFVLTIFLLLIYFDPQEAIGQDSDHCRHMRWMLEDAIAARDGFNRAAPNAPQSSKDAMENGVRSMRNRVRQACGEPRQCDQRGLDRCKTIEDSYETLDELIKTNEDLGSRYNEEVIEALGASILVAVPTVTATALCLAATGVTVVTFGLGSPSYLACALALGTTVGATYLFSGEIADAVRMRRQIQSNRQQILRLRRQLKRIEPLVGEEPYGACIAIRRSCGQ